MNRVLFCEGRDAFHCPRRGQITTNRKNPPCGHEILQKVVMLLVRKENLRALCLVEFSKFPEMLVDPGTRIFENILYAPSESFVGNL